MDYSLPYVNSITAFLFTIIIVSYYFSRRWRPAKLAPTEAKGAWPIFGHLPLLGGSTPTHITLAAMADKYGPLFTIRLGVYPSLVISSSEIAKECFTTNDLVLNSRPKLSRLWITLATPCLRLHPPDPSGERCARLPPWSCSLTEGLSCSDAFESLK
ncbi:hypothetical protein CerSpe_041510 [Prunus speciosa]